MYSIKNKKDIQTQNTEIVKSNNNIPKVIAYKNISSKEAKNEEISPKKKKIHNNKKKKKKKTNITDSTEHRIEKDKIQDSVFINSENNDSTMPSDTIFTDTNNLIISHDTLINNINDSIEYKLLGINDSSIQEINISEDELIYASLVYPEGKRDNFACKSANKYDSVLVNNIPSTQDGLYVEIWQSPINLIGYKLTTNTLILYGIYEYGKIKLRYTENGAIELKYKNNTILLKCTDIFKPIIIK